MRGYISQLPADLLPSAPRRLAVMGCTGSIGVNTLDVAARHPEAFQVTALAAGQNAVLLAEQADRFRPGFLAVQDEGVLERLIPLLPSGYRPEILVGPEGYAQMASLPQADLVVSAQVGAAGLAATEAAARNGKVIALANKESLVLAGELIRELCRASGAVILPVDSEHNAIFQCLHGRDMGDVHKLILTASGGPFHGKDAACLASVTPEQALRHPNWSMGAKISIDSATMMNKGLEIIEACHLYGLPGERVDVLVHRQSIVHSLVEFRDGSLLAQCAPPDMRLPISHALSWPRCLEPAFPRLDLSRAASLTFELPDLSLFPCLGLAREALGRGGGYPVVLNAANEVAVELFLAGRIAFTDIARLVAGAMEAHDGANPASLAGILELDAAARNAARQDWAKAGNGRACG